MGDQEMSDNRFMQAQHEGSEDESKSEDESGSTSDSKSEDESDDEEMPTDKDDKKSSNVDAEPEEGSKHDHVRIEAARVLAAVEKSEGSRSISSSVEEVLPEAVKEKAAHVLAAADEAEARRLLNVSVDEKDCLSLNSSFEGHTPKTVKKEKLYSSP